MRKFFSTFWHVIKTKHTCGFGESGIGRTSGGWKYPEPTSLGSVSSGNFQPPRCVQSQTHLPASMFVIESNKLQSESLIAKKCRTPESFAGKATRPILRSTPA